MSLLTPASYVLLSTTLTCYLEVRKSCVREASIDGVCCFLWKVDDGSTEFLQSILQLVLHWISILLVCYLEEKRYGIRGASFDRWGLHCAANIVDSGATDLLQSVLQFVGPVCRVYVNHHQAHLRCGVLSQHPLQGVRSPDPHTVTFFQTYGQEAGRQPINLSLSEWKAV